MIFLRKAKLNSNFMPQSPTSHSSASSSSMEEDDMRTLLKAGGTTYILDEYCVDGNLMHV